MVRKNKKTQKIIIGVVIAILFIGVISFLIFKAPECNSGEDKCDGSIYYICQDEKWVSQGEIAGKCGVVEEQWKETFYRLANNVCSAVSIYPEDKTVNDYLTLEDCQSQIDAEFPVIASSSNSFEAEKVVNHTIDLPDDISSGDLLIIFFSTYRNNVATFPDGWNKFFEVSQERAITETIAWKEATGLEGDSIIVTIPIAQKSAHISYRITGAEDPDVQSPEASIGVVGGWGNFLKPDSLTPTGGSKRYLWIASYSKMWGILSANGPTGYIDLESYNSGVGYNDVSIGTAMRELEALSEKPDRFHVPDPTGSWVACTVAIPPK